jgi:hypothetical protein
MSIPTSTRHVSEFSEKSTKLVTTQARITTS